MRRLSVVLSLLILAVASHAAPASRSGEPRATRHEVLAPTHALTDADRAELAAKGIVIGAPMADGKHVVRVAVDANVDDPRIASLTPIEPEQKIDPSALHSFAIGRTTARVNVVFHKDVDYDTARTAILAAGGIVDPLKTRFSPSQRVEISISSPGLQALAANDDVLAIVGVRNLKVRSDNAITAQVMHVTELYSAPYNLTGEGVTVSLFELAEAQADHPEFANGSRLAVHASGGTTTDKGHATHVAGTIGAAGVNAAAKGMAPNVRMHEYCIQVPCGGTLKYLEQKEDNLQSLGVIADNNSWGFVLGWNLEDGYWVWNDYDVLYGAYSLTYTSPIDEISNDKGILFVHSAGNDADQFPANFDSYNQHRHTDENDATITNKLFCYSKNGTGSDCPASCNGGCETTQHHPTLPYDTIGVTASAKNVITVGAVDANLNIESYSSRGPAKDGRIKPEVVTRGASVLSSMPGSAYGYKSGTSMATPVVTGISALLTEQWRRTFAGANPTPAQLKALFIAGTTDIGPIGPDYTFGFGAVNAKNSVDIILADGGTGKRIRNLTFANGEGATQEIPIIVPSTQNVRVVLQWPDPTIVFTSTGSSIAERALVNNLDLKVVGPDNTTYLPWKLDKNAPTAAATKGANTVDNTEMVDISNAAAGTYRIVVTGTRVTQGPQAAVVISSVATAPACSDAQEPNNDAATAYGNITGGSTLTGAICTQGDIDFFKFNATKTGGVSVTITARDTPLRVTLTGTGISRTQDIAANSTATLNADANTVPNAITVRVEAIGTPGVNPSYLITPTFGLENGKRRRSTRH